MNGRRKKALLPANYAAHRRRSLDPHTPDTGTQAAARPPKSLMKTSALTTRKAPIRAPAAAPDHAPSARTAARKRTVPAAAGRQQKIEERIAAASEELASGITEASSAAEELRRAMEQIASGAEEAASASQETLSVAASARPRWCRRANARIRRGGARSVCRAC